MSDPFRHHPGLKGRIKPFAESYFRTITTEQVRATLAERGLPDSFPFHPDAVREGLRREALAGHAGDLWVFAYGSLIWDPALDFAEVRRAHAPGHARRFILVDRHGGRGTAEAPGLMAALDHGAGCEGVAFRIAADKVDRETEILFRREMIGPGYHARFIPVEIAGRAARALSFLADHDDPSMEGDIARAVQVRYAATGVGFLGTSYDYLASTVAHLAEVGIEDEDASALLEDVRTYRDGRAGA
ncbi:gamma-glutamylcyclotransferase [Roseicyclus marinus]|uniref:gamma-glutamylcyclotransferase n=1 Tax=Roseicyclus marinus TaxID=2161673 RepID=UPI0024105906|nr:gamma-glutamylcyclotransferase [Roseicyclus marinus]MDG3040859.1 gamma-glutamylcyclotransferase [Roseicyclus marinus]